MLQRFLFSCTLSILLLSVPSSSRGQDFGAIEDSYINTLARPGEPTITVYLWGSVGQTGIWRIKRETDLIAFLSAVQVPGIGEEQIGIRRRTTLRVFRGSAGDRQEVYSERLDEILEEGASYPDLQNEDVLLVETSQRREIFTFQFISTFIGTTSSAILLVLRLTGNL